MPRYEYRYRRPQRRRVRLHVVLFALLMVLSCLYPFVEPGLLTIEEHTLYVSNLPQNLKNIRIAFAADIHKGPWFSQKRVEEVFRTLNNMSADLIILGGDYAMDSDGAVAFFENVPPLQARMGVYGIVGNHDRTQPETNLRLLTNAMADAGIVPLVNAVSRVKIGQSYVYVAGVDDYYNGFPDVAGVASQVHSDDLVIFAGHTPDLLPEMLKATSADGDGHWFDLALFGHTHGGQINLFGWTPFSNVSENISARYLSGWLEENRAGLLISNGVGTSVFPVRLFARPQVHLITLKSR